MATYLVEASRRNNGVGDAPFAPPIPHARAVEAAAAEHGWTMRSVALRADVTMTVLEAPPHARLDDLLASAFWSARLHGAVAWLLGRDEDVDVALI